MKKILLTSIIYLCCFYSYAQTSFERSFDITNSDSASCIQQTSDGGFIICGSTKNSVSGKYDVLVLKINSTGSKIWSKTFGGANDDKGNFIKETNDGGYILTGLSKSYNWGDQNMYLLKIDMNGEIIWSSTFGSYGSDAGHAVIQTADGGYAVTGSSNYMDGRKSMYLLKAASDGTGIFESHFAFDGTGNSVIETSNGDFAISGTLNLNDSLSTNILIRADKYGNKIWTKTYGGSSSFTGKTVLQTGDGGFLTGGAIINTNGIGSSYLLKTDSLGLQQWSRSYNAGEGMSISSVPNGYLLTGMLKDSSAASMTFTKTDMTGNSLGTILIGAEGFASPVFCSGVNSNVVVGNIITTSGNQDIYVVKANVNGTFCSESLLNSIDSSIVLIETSYVFQALTYYSTENQYGMVPYSTVIVSAAVDANVSTTEICNATPMVAYIPAPSDFQDIGESSDLAPEDADQVLKGFVAGSTANEFSVYPNPSEGSNFNISLYSQLAEEILVVVYDQLGREHYSKIIITEENSNNIFAVDPSENLSPGIYMVTATSAKETLSKRLIVK